MLMYVVCNLVPKDTTVVFMMFVEVLSPSTTNLFVNGRSNASIQTKVKRWLRFTVLTALEKEKVWLIVMLDISQNATSIDFHQSHLISYSFALLQIIALAKTSMNVLVRSTIMAYCCVKSYTTTQNTTCTILSRMNPVKYQVWNQIHTPLIV